MILLTRVDHRLLHGQVATSWVKGLGADCIFCVGDAVANDPVWKTTLKLGKPSGCKLVIKDIANAIEAINSGVTDKYRMLICVQTIADAKALIDGCPRITSLNLGNTKQSATTREVSRQVFLEKEELEIIRELSARGVEVEIRPLADDKKEDAIALTKDW
ncbi:MAG: PTS sugar transporter subunit IIB [Collinsella sp.]|nr:PTS sugar transporter subunit IIB [Collinsella sp.]